MTNEAPLRSLSRLAIAACALWLALLASPLARANPGGTHAAYHIVGQTTTKVTAHLRRTAFTVQVGADLVNRFEMVHVVKEGACEARGALLILPPISAGFENYEIDESNGYAGSYAAYFADRDYDVWGLSQRTQGMVAGACEGGLDCSAMANWGMQTLLEDADYVRGQIEKAGLAHGRKPVVGGLSLGSMAATAMIDWHPEDYSGAILQEGAIYQANAGDQVIAQGFCQQFSSLLANGVYYDDQQLPGLKAVGHLAAAAPLGPSPLPGMPPGFTNHQAFIAVMSNPGISPLTPRPGYYFLDGNPFADAFVYANDALAENNIAAFVDYTSVHMLRDIDCGLGGERTFTGNLGKFKGPVLVIAGGHGFGPGMLDTVPLMTKAKVETHFTADFGHMDAYFAVNHRDYTERPILEWLEREVFGR